MSSMKHLTCFITMAPEAVMITNDIQHKRAMKERKEATHVIPKRSAAAGLYVENFLFLFYPSMYNLYTRIQKDRQLQRTSVFYFK